MYISNFLASSACLVFASSTVVTEEVFSGDALGRGGGGSATRQPSRLTLRLAVSGKKWKSCKSIHFCFMLQLWFSFLIFLCSQVDRVLLPREIHQQDFLIAMHVSKHMLDILLCMYVILTRYVSL